MLLHIPNHVLASPGGLFKLKNNVKFHETTSGDTKIVGKFSVFLFTCKWNTLVGGTNTGVADLFAFWFQHFSDSIPDQPSGESNYYLNNSHDQPKNAHYQEKHKLQNKQKCSVTYFRWDRLPYEKVTNSRRLNEECKSRIIVLLRVLKTN